MLIKHSERPNQDQFGAEPSYQINTGKVFKGHKLTVKEAIQRQRIKSKNSSPTNKHKQVNNFNNIFPKMTDFSQKYKGLQTLDDEQSLYRFITYQREKQSRESARGMKLFSCQKRCQDFDEDDFINSHISFTPRQAKTSQSHRKNHSSISYSHNKTISHEKQDQSSLQYTNKQITFLSDNLGKRMNEYLNIILQKKEKAEIIINDNQTKEEEELYKLKNHLINQVRVTNKQAKIKTTTFYRQMKKSNKNRLLSAQTVASSQVKSNELVKSLLRKTAANFNQKTPMTCQKLYSKSFSAKIRDKKQQQSTSKSFYSKNDYIQRQSHAAQNDHTLKTIYKK